MTWDEIRKARNNLLSKTDWTQAVDVQSSMPEQEKIAWAAFRKKLRDITTDFQSPDDVAFPEPPKTNF